MLCERQPGELGRYRRYLAAKVFAGSLAKASDTAINHTACEWAELAADDDSSDEEWPARRSDDEREQLRRMRRRVRRYYVHKVCQLNKIMVDHLADELERWMRLMSAGMATARHDDYRAEIESRFSALGYGVRWELLDAADYGVPQHRGKAQPASQSGLGFGLASPPPRAGWTCPARGAQASWGAAP